MKASKKIAAIALAIGLSFTLTACDPPMPEDLRVALAEKTVLCEPGAVELEAPDTITDIAYGWSDAMATGCADMSLTVTDALTDEAGLVIAPQGANLSQSVFLKVPFALDAAVLVVNLPDVYEIYLSATTIQAIFAGEVTSWNDPLILADNDGLELPAEKIILPTEALPAAKNSLATWIESLTGAQLEISKIADSKLTETELATPAEVGAISIASYSAALLNGSVFATVLTEAGNIESGILASTETVYAASTQLVAEAKGDVITMAIDTKLEPTAPEGSIEAALPYQAIFAVELSFTGTESALVLTAGRFLLRQESQGVITSSTMLPIPERVRILAVKVVEKALVLPKSE